MCVCVFVFVFVGEWKVLLLCSVMSAIPVPSKNFLESLGDLGTVACCEGCISEHKQAVPHSVLLQN